MPELNLFIVRFGHVYGCIKGKLFFQYYADCVDYCPKVHELFLYVQCGQEL